MAYSKKLFSDLLSNPSYRDKVAVVYEDIPYTYDELRRSVELCAGDLFQRGVRAGDQALMSGARG